MSTGKHILIIDDSVVSRMMIKKGITDICPECSLLEAKDAKDALEQAKEHHDINCFSIDYNMPGMDGLELMEKLNQQFPEAKKALLTANIQDSTREKTLSLGGECINKPITEASIQQLMSYFND